MKEKSVYEGLKYEETPVRCPHCNNLIRNYGIYPQYLIKTGRCLNCKKKIDIVRKVERDIQLRKPKKQYRGLM